MVGCGAEVTILGDDVPNPPVIGPEPDPKPDPKPEPEPEPPIEVCGTNFQNVVVAIVEGASCSFGSGSMGPIEGVDARPDIDGIAFRAPGCHITVAGVGSDIAASYSITNLHLDYRLEPDSIELYVPEACDFCVTCECPLPLPLFYAADTLFDPVNTIPIPRTVTVTRGEEVCSEDGVAGCSWLQHRIDVDVIQVEGNSNLDTAPILLGSTSVNEGDTGEAYSYHVRNLRSTGPGPDCLGQWGNGDAAWAIFREVAPTL